MKRTLSTTTLPILTALSSSLWCITPLLTLVAGTGGLASTFAWLEPFRPLIVGVTLALLGFAWYVKIKPQKEDDCNCPPANYCPPVNVNTIFLKSKHYLSMVTLIAILLLSFPMYSFVFFPNNKQSAVAMQTEGFQKVEFAIKGISCSGCEKPVSSQINTLKGIASDSVSYAKSKVIVKFDKAKATIGQLEKAINSTGYRVVKTELK